LIQAGFGGTDSEIDALVGTDAADWIASQMQLPATRTLPLMQAKYLTSDETDAHHSRMLWQTLLTADDELRQRMMFALSQIFVISTEDFFDQGYASAYYSVILVDQAFGSYRERMSGQGTSFSWFDQVDGYRHQPLAVFDDVHSPLEKSFLGTTIPENTGGAETITQALDTIAAHPNVAPFISRQLIQRFTASSPAPDYVKRVAEVFEAGLEYE